MSKVAGRVRLEWLWRLGALLCGGLSVFAFPAPALWWWAFFSLVPATLVIGRAPTRRTGIIRGWWAAAGYAMTAIYWTIPNIGPALLLVAFALGALYILWGWLVWEFLSKPLTVMRTIEAFIVIPCAWLTAELARSWSSLGGPWALLGVSQFNDRNFLSMASFGGVWLVSLALVGINSAIAISLTHQSNRSARIVALGLAVAVAVFGFSFGIIRGDPKPNGWFKVAMVQPGPGLGPAARFRAEIKESASVAKYHPQLIVWGESSVSYDLASDKARLDQLKALSLQMKADILVNEDAYMVSKVGTYKTKAGIYKTAALINSSGIISTYEKMRLVPFGEYIPFRDELGWLSDISKAAGVNRKRGKSLKVMELGVGLPPIGPLICFEETFPDMSRKLAGLDAQILIYQTSDSTFQQSWEPAQQASLAAVRAVEDERPAINVALTGITSAFDAGGKQLAWYQTNKRGAFVVNLPLTYPTDFFVRWGYWVPYGAVIVLLIAGIVGLVGLRKSGKYKPIPKLLKIKT